MPAFSASLAAMPSTSTPDSPKASISAIIRRVVISADSALYAASRFGLYRLDSKGLLATGADYRHRTDNRPCRQRRLSSAAHTLRGLSVDWRVRLGESPAPRPCRAAATQPFSLDFPYPFRRGSRTAGQNPCRHPRRSLDRAVHHRLYHSAAPTRPYRRARIIGVAPPPRPLERVRAHVPCRHRHDAASAAAHRHSPTQNRPASPQHLARRPARRALRHSARPLACIHLRRLLYPVIRPVRNGTNR